ncbi:UNC93-like protein [Glycine soja]|uniref:UNC93-like protein n=1 Tax=Glycine soja TaxID=3848 RepID=A0A0B2P3A4_GLYSO|nr:UNC93-like protein [Glycine soja]
MGTPGNDEPGTQTPQNTKSSPLFRYNSPFIQIVLIGLVCFCCPGMFNALSGMGGGGQVNSTALQSLTILPASKVVRDDGTRCTKMLYSNAATESVEILKLFYNWKMLLIIPAAWSSNFFYTYQFNHVNKPQFNLRTRGFNNVFYWGAQMVGSVGIGYVMDFSFRSRRKRGVVGIGVVALLASAIWGGALANQIKHDPGVILDFKDSGSRYAGPFVLYFSFGLLDAVFQSMVYWVIGALANDSEILSRYAGFYKGIQSAGAAVAWQIDNHNVSAMAQLIVNWVLTTVSYPLLLILVVLAVKEGDNRGEEEPVKEVAGFAH